MGPDSVSCLESCSQAFKESCQKFYQAELEELSFAKDTEECRKHINDWVTKKTEGERFHFGRLGESRRKGSRDGLGCDLHGVAPGTLSPVASVCVCVCACAAISGHPRSSVIFIGLIRSQSGDLEEILTPGVRISDTFPSGLDWKILENHILLEALFISCLGGPWPCAEGRVTSDLGGS